jgi:hypothetical protein
VLEEEVLVAPALESRVEIAAKGCQRFTAHAMEVHRILLHAVVGREVHPAAEPDDRRRILRHGSEQAHVHVHRGHVRVARVQHERHAHRFERRASERRPVRGGRGRHRRTADMAEVAAAALEEIPLLDETGDAVALQAFARLARPGIGEEGLAIQRGQRLDDA